MRRHIAVSVLTILIASAAPALADDAHGLPPGPIHDRHGLMEGIGDNAEIIGDALKGGSIDPVGDAAAKIQADAAKALSLFPKGSTHPESRAKPEIWERWEEFESLMKELEAKAGELAAAARGGGADVGVAAKAVFGNCKSCHDDFRKPDEKKES